MSLVTGTPLGSITTQDDLYLDSSPYVYYQDYTATELFNPDGDGFYWGLSGTTSYPVYQLGCYEGVQLAGNIEMTSVRCDHVGDKAAIQKLTYIDLTFTLKTLLPLSTLRGIIRGGAVTTTVGATEKMGIGDVDNQQYWRVYLPMVYDVDTGDYVCITGHRCQFVDSWQLSFTFGQPATMGVTLRMFADDTLPAAQRFATIIRADPSAL